MKRSFAHCLNPWRWTKCNISVARFSYGIPQSPRVCRSHDALPPSSKVRETQLPESKEEDPADMAAFWALRIMRNWKHAEWRTQLSIYTNFFRYFYATFQIALNSSQKLDSRKESDFMPQTLRMKWKYLFIRFTIRSKFSSWQTFR